MDQAWPVEVREILSAPTLELGDWEAHVYTWLFFNVKVSSGQNIVKRKWLQEETAAVEVTPGTGTNQACSNIQIVLQT